MKGETKFYHVFKFGNYIGVNEYGLKDIAMIKLTTLVVMVAMSAVLATFLPMLLSVFYVFLLLLDFRNETSKEEKKLCSLFIIISTIYFIIDYRFGLLSSFFFSHFDFSEGYQYVASINILLGLIHLFFLFSVEELMASNTNLTATILYLAFIGLTLYMFLEKLNNFVGKVIPQHIFEIN